MFTVLLCCSGGKVGLSLCGFAGGEKASRGALPASVAIVVQALHFSCFVLHFSRFIAALVQQFLGFSTYFRVFPAISRNVL